MQINSFDVCCLGFERLRNRTEFLLVASIAAGSTAADIRQQLHDDIQCCDRPDGFDYEGCRALVDKWVDEYMTTPNPFGLDPALDNEPDDYDGGVRLFLYIEADPEIDS
jgi:hypothetical protein